MPPVSPEVMPEEDDGEAAELAGIDTVEEEVSGAEAALVATGRLSGTVVIALSGLSKC